MRAPLQIDHLRAIVLMMVPGVRLDAAHNEILRGNAEIKRLQRSLQSMASAEALRRAEEKAAGLAVEVAQLRTALDSMVPSRRHAAVQEEGRRAAAEVQRLMELVDRMVPREQLLACQARAEQVGTISRLISGVWGLPNAQECLSLCLFPMKTHLLCPCIIIFRS